jgi:hypothetical protein
MTHAKKKRPRKKATTNAHAKMAPAKRKKTAAPKRALARKNGAAKKRGGRAPRGRAAKNAELRWMLRKSHGDVTYKKFGAYSLRLSEKTPAEASVWIGMQPYWIKFAPLSAHDASRLGALPGSTYFIERVQEPDDYTAPNRHGVVTPRGEMLAATIDVREVPLPAKLPRGAVGAPRSDRDRAIVFAAQRFAETQGGALAAPRGNPGGIDWLAGLDAFVHTLAH